ncbi:MAG: cyclic nucleotide-binding domain-containing protein [Caldilineaceae bacterium]|nr:cyclic nucleotide-binding domain-containing protein [Caldilineaceae bacterium]
MRNLEPIIAEHDFFKGMAAHHIEFVVGCAKNARFDPGALLFREGEAANDFYLIRHGMVSIELLVLGRGVVPIQTVGRNDVLGWSWLFEPYHWHFQARAVELTRTLIFDGRCLRDACERDHDLGYALMKRFAGIMVQRLEATRLQMLDVYAKG